MDSSGGNSSSNTEMSSSPPKSKGDSHFTPAVRQFSAPKAFRDTEYVPSLYLTLPSSSNIFQM